MSIEQKKYKKSVSEKKEPPLKKIEMVRRLIRINFSNNKVRCKLHYLRG